MKKEKSHKDYEEQFGMSYESTKKWLNGYRMALEFTKELWGKHCSFCGKKLEGVYTYFMKDVLMCEDCENEMKEVCLL